MMLTSSNERTPRKHMWMLAIAALAALVISGVAALSLTSCQLVGKSPYFASEDNMYDIMDGLLVYQKETDKRIEQELANARNTLENPCVIENPYDTAPLTALIIFQTKNETAIDVSINGASPVRFEQSTTHAIPVYGLLENTVNEVSLTDEAGNTNTVSITTPEAGAAALAVEQPLENAGSNVFLVSPDYEKTAVYDAQGKLLWCLDFLDNEGAVVFLGDGRFLLSDPYQGSGGIRINYSGFVEMDYLGKIRTLYVGEYGYHHEIERVDNNAAFLLPGHDENSLFMQDVVYLVDAQTMQPLQTLSFYQVFNQLVPDWVAELTKDGKFNFVINGADYDEATGDVIVSVRATGMIIRANMETGEIKWIFADPNGVPEQLQKYLLTPTDNTRWPYGQHACQFLADGRIAYHNNDIDFMQTDLELSNLAGHYSSNEILVVDEANKEVHTDWTYDGQQKILSRMSGSLEFLDTELENGHKLVSYGSAVRQECFNDPENYRADDFANTDALMMELDENDRTVWRAVFPSVIHKVYKTQFYATDAEAFPNYHVVAYQQIDGQDASAHLGEAFDVAAVSQELRAAQSLEGRLSVHINRAVLECTYNNADAIDILFVGEDGQGTLFNYKQANVDVPIVNSGKYGIRVAGLAGKQKAYVRIADTWYNTGVITDFDPAVLEQG